MEPAEPELQRLARAIRGLTIAIGALGAIFLIVFAAYVVTVFQQRKFYEDLTRRGPEMSSSSSHHGKVTSSEFRSGQPEGVMEFHDLPPERKIERASAILLTRFEKKNGQYREVVTEILKKRPDSRLAYAVGDEFRLPGGTQFPDDVVISMDGQVVFMTGSPAEMRFATSYSKGSASGLGNMPLSKLRELARNAK